MYENRYHIKFIYVLRVLEEHATAQMWKSEADSYSSCCVFHPLGLKAPIQVFRCGGEGLHPLDQLTGPCFGFKWEQENMWLMKQSPTGEGTVVMIL